VPAAVTAVAARLPTQGSAAWPGWHSQTGPDGLLLLPELLLLLEQPLAVKPAAITSAAPATATRRARNELACLFMITKVAGLARPAAGVEPPTAAE
jgi:hypothetical protein